jgi:formylglycine-generating enzyme required for sulfatase activity
VNNSAYTSPLSKKFLFPAPSNLQIISMTNTQVDFSWTDNSSFETSFEVEQSSNGTTFAVVKTVESNITSTSITGTFDITTIYYFRVQAKTTINKSGYSNIAHMQINSGMVLVQGGTFQMGSTSGYSDEVPVHSVTLGSFNIDKYEVTYEKWTDVYNWGLTHGYTDLPAGQNGYSPNGANNPVTSVNWYDIIKWCNARSEMEGLTPVYYTSNTSMTVYRTGQVDLAADAVKWTTNGYRLPTEAEWEFAARGGNNSQGYTYSGSNTIDYVAWYYNNSGYTTHTIGTKSANEVGIYDMSGNVWEWCWDWYGTYSGTAQTDPKGATSGAYRVLRGGSFNGDVVGYCRVAVRYDVNPYGRGINVGFRCTRD